MLLPIRGSLGSQYLLHRLQRFSLHNTREERLLLVIQTGKLGEAYMWKVIGTKTQKPPLLNRHGSWQLELVLQVAELFLKYQIIIICLCRDLLQQACLPQEESLHLKQTVPMLVYGAEWKAVCPCLESIPIQPEAEVTSKSNEENIFPMMIGAAGI